MNFIEPYIYSPYITSSLEYGAITTEDLGFFQRFYEIIIFPITFAFEAAPYFNEILKIRKELGIETMSMSSGLDTRLFLFNGFFGFDVY